MLSSADIAGRVFAEDPDEVLERLWELMAACARYGRQRIPDLLDMTMSDALRFKKALVNLIRQEAKASEGSGLLGPERGA